MFKTLSPSVNPTLISLRKLSPFLIASLTFLGIPLIVTAQTQSAPVEGTAEPIAPMAERLLREASDYLKAAKAYSFQAEIVFDDVFPPDLKLQYHSTAKVLVDRPDRLRIDYTGDRRNVSFYYNGKDFTMFDRKEKVYASFAAPPTIDATLNLTLKDFGFLVPVADFAYSDPYQAFGSEIQQGFYLGLVSLNGRQVHHLAFTQENINWQIWIEDGKQPLIRKLVITYKSLTAAPQYIVEFPRWDFNGKQSNDSLFSFQAPENAVKIEFLPTATP